jgi:hypothetical protein
MPRIKDTFEIRYDAFSKKFIMVWPKWFIVSMGWNRKQNKTLILKHKINPEKGEITFRAHTAPGIGYYFNLDNYYSDKNKNKQKQLQREIKAMGFALMPPSDKKNREYFIASNSRALEIDIEELNNSIEDNNLKLKQRQDDLAIIHKTAKGPLKKEIQKIKQALKELHLQKVKKEQMLKKANKLKRTKKKASS